MMVKFILGALGAALCSCWHAVLRPEVLLHALLHLIRHHQDLQGQETLARQFLDHRRHKKFLVGRYLSLKFFRCPNDVRSLIIFDLWLMACERPVPGFEAWRDVCSFHDGESSSLSIIRSTLLNFSD